jgi:hypothetical protein
VDLEEEAGHRGVARIGEDPGEGEEGLTTARVSSQKVTQHLN